MKWIEQIRIRFRDRQELAPQDLLIEFGVSAGFTATDPLGVLNVFEEEYGIPAGRLRAADPLSWFNETPQTRHPIKAYFDRSVQEDRLSANQAVGGQAPRRSSSLTTEPS